MNNYLEFLRKKQQVKTFPGIDINLGELNQNLFDWQKAIVKWALKKGRSALFEDCGLGKTIQQLEWAKQVYINTGKDVLILAPLAVVEQTVREGLKFGIDVNICRDQKDVQRGINITNYDILDKFDPSCFGGVVLDESSIIKSFDGETTRKLISNFDNTPYRLACTATPAPNDYTELANHVEFLGIMRRQEMLSMYFQHDGGNTSKWVLKAHSQAAFWRWCASWCMYIKKPSDIGYSDAEYNLPKLEVNEIILPSPTREYEMFPEVAKTLEDRRIARKESLSDRVRATAALVNNSNENWLVWCDFNYESEALKKAIDNSVEVRGNDTPEYKAKAGVDFSQDKTKALVSKSKIYGFGMNWQNCHNMVFCGISDSYEQYYQAVRRCWRFGQKYPVNVYIVISEREKAVLDNIKRKSAAADNMNASITKYTSTINAADLSETKRITETYQPMMRMSLPGWI